MRLERDGTVGHGSGGKTAHDVGNGFDLLYRHSRSRTIAELKQSPQGHESACLIIHAIGVLAKNVVSLVPCRVLESKDRLRVEEVGFALAAPLVFPANIQASMGRRDAAGRVGDVMSGAHLSMQDVKANTTEPGDRPGEVALHQQV